MVKVKIEGLDALRKGLKSYEKSVETGTNQALKNTSVNIARTARGLVGVNSIRGTISAVQEGNNYGVVTRGAISAYREFGTGNFAAALLSRYPEDWKDMARVFFINGQGRIPAKPYLYPAFKMETAPNVLQQEIKKEIEKR